MVIQFSVIVILLLFGYIIVTSLIPKQGRDNSSYDKSLFEPTDSVIYSALPLTKYPENYADFEALFRFIISDMNKIFSRGSNIIPPVAVFTFKDDSEKLNDMFIQSLPPDISKIVSRQDNSPSLSGDGNRTILILPYAHDPFERIGNIVHEFYHVLQMRLCTKIPFLDNAFVWLKEGCAAIAEHVYIMFYFRNHPSIDSINGISRGMSSPSGILSEGWVITNTRNEALQDGFVFGKAQEKYSGTISNYDRSRTAVLFLAWKLSSKGGLSFVLRDLLNDVICKSVYSNPTDENFTKAFGFSKQSFYDEFNSWLVRPFNSEENIIPTFRDCANVFIGTTEPNFPINLLV